MSDVGPFENPKALAKDLREKIGMSAGYASDLAAGKRQPSLDMAVKIERELGIPAAAWIDRPAHTTSDAA